jgi:serine phosphatase RsbU (regulator of sigma subunit)
LFATAVVATYWSPTEELTICNAGHPRPLRFAAASGRWEPLVSAEPGPTAGPSNLPLGIGLEAAHPQMTVRLRPGDLVLFYTDSLIEARRPTGEQLGELGLLRLVSSINAAEPAAFIRALLAAVGRWRGDAEGPDLPEFADDVTAVLIRPNALGPHPSIVLDLLAVWRITTHFVRSLVRRDTVASWPQARREVIAGTFLGRRGVHKNDQAK